MKKKIKKLKNILVNCFSNITFALAILSSLILNELSGEVAEW